MACDRENYILEYSSFSIRTKVCEQFFVSFVAQNLEIIIKKGMMLK